MAGLFCGLVRPVSAVVLIRGANSNSDHRCSNLRKVRVSMLTSNKCVQCTAIHIASCIADGACALLVLQPDPAVCKQTALHRLITGRRGHVVVGLGLILGHMTKCTHMQGICTIVHCLHMYCVWLTS